MEECNWPDRKEWVPLRSVLFHGGGRYRCWEHSLRASYVNTRIRDNLGYKRNAAPASQHPTVVGSQPYVPNYCAPRREAFGSWGHAAEDWMPLRTSITEDSEGTMLCKERATGSASKVVCTHENPYGSSKIALSKARGNRF